MAGSQTKTNRRSQRSSPKQSSRRRSPKQNGRRSSQQRSGRRSARPPSASRRAADRRPSEHAQEAMQEWGKAVRYAAAAVAPVAKRTGEGAKNLVLLRGDRDRPSLRERLSPATTDKGGRLGDAADWLLARMGVPGKLASKVSVGSRVVERVRSRRADDESEDAEDEPEDAEYEPEAAEYEDEPEDQLDEEYAEEPEQEDEEYEDEGADEEPEDEPRHAYSDAIRHYSRPPDAYADVTE